MSCDNCDCAKCKASRAKSPPGYGSEKPVECSLCNGTGSVWYPDRGGGWSDNCPPLLGEGSMKRRSGVAIAAMARRAGPMKDRRAPRGGQRNDQVELLEEHRCYSCGQPIDLACDVCDDPTDYR